MFRNLCVSGAGTQGAALMGALIGIHKKGYLNDIRDVCGVSFGAILVSLWSLGWDPSDLYERIKLVNVSDFCKINVRNFFDTFGLSSTTMLMDIIDTLIIEKGFDKNITFREHIYHTDILLRIPALCLNNHELIYFSHLSHPNLPIREAIRASLSIPFLFTAPIIDEKHFVDGGVIRHLPYDPYIDHEEETICLRIKYTPRHEDKIDKLETFILSLMTSLHQSASIVPAEFKHIIEVDSGYEGVNFSIQSHDIHTMMERGIQASEIKPSE